MKTPRPSRTARFHAVLVTLFCALALGKALFAVPTEPRTPESAVTPVERSRHTDFLREIKAAKGDFDFVLIGDSITDWWPKKNGPESYARFAPWKPLDLGVAAETTEEVLWRLQNGELDGIHPKVIMLMIGTNNLGKGDKPEWAVAGIKKILETIRAKQPQAKILLLGIFPRAASAQDGIRKRIAEANQLLPSLADGQNIFYMDIGPKFLDPQGNLTKEIMPDLLHPNAKGYQIWIEAVGPKLQELMGSPLGPQGATMAPATSTSDVPTVSVKLTPLRSEPAK